MARNGHFFDGFAARDLPEERHEVPGFSPSFKEETEEQSSMGAISIPGNSMGKPTVKKAAYTSSMGNWGAKGYKK